VCNVAYTIVISFLYIGYTSWVLFSFLVAEYTTLLCISWLGRYKHGYGVIHGRGHRKYLSEYKESVRLHLTVGFSEIQQKERGEAVS